MNRLPLLLLPLVMPLVAWGGEYSPLVHKVREATAIYKDVNVAIYQGFVPATPCVSGPDHGAMGVHYVLMDRLNKGVLKAEEPESLIYEPLGNGGLRLVGVEYIVLESVWLKQNHKAGVPELDGNLMNYIAAPNRFGLPAFYELHVWAWEDNSLGTMADWNNSVRCDRQPLTQ